MSSETPSLYGAQNPGAPAELAQFGFLIGRWRGQGLFRNEDGTHSPYRVDWSGRYILDGHAIADDARVLDEEGELQALFVTYRFYDRAERRWVIEVFDAGYRIGKTLIQPARVIVGRYTEPETAEA